MSKTVHEVSLLIFYLEDKGWERVEPKDYLGNSMYSVEYGNIYKSYSGIFIVTKEDLVFPIKTDLISMS